MRAYLTPLIFFQRFFIPGLVLLLCWALWRVVSKKDRGVGVAMYVALVIIVDSYMNTGIYLPGVEKGSIHYSEAWALILFFTSQPAQPTAKVPRSVYWLVSLYFGLLLASTLRSDTLLSALLEFRQMVFPQIVAILVAKRGLDTPDAYRRFFLCLAGLSIVVGVFIFWDLFFDRVFLHSDTLNKGIYYHNRKLNRFGSFFLNPNYLGAFVVLTFPMLFVWTLKERSWWPRLLTLGGLLALVFCLVETQSRAPMLAFAIVTVFLILGPTGEVSRTRRFAFFGVFVAVLFLVMPGFFQHAIGRFDRIEEETTTDSGRSRATTWRYTVRMIVDHPVVGIGFGEPQFMKYMDLYGFGDEFEGVSLDAPHNSYLQVAVYAGIPTLLAFLAANALLLWSAAKSMMRSAGRDSTTQAITFGLGVAVVGFLMSIYPDIQLFTVSVAPAYWVSFAFLHSLASARLPQGAAVQTISAIDAPAPLSWWTAVPDRAGQLHRSAPIVSGTSPQGTPDAAVRGRRRFRTSRTA